MPSPTRKAVAGGARLWAGGMLAVGPALVIAGFAATAVGPTPSPESRAGNRGPRHSPFVVRLNATGPFHAISFKDVGMSVPSERRSYLYESIAEGLALALSTKGPMSMPSEVRYSSELTDPENHLACESGHIYVDMWQNQSADDGASSDYWGYSLWSGCGEDDRFAWKEIPVRHGNSLASVAPFTRDIATSIRRAIETQCFTRHC